jgi:hypothetical protein
MRAACEACWLFGLAGNCALTHTIHASMGRGTEPLQPSMHA